MAEAVRLVPKGQAEANEDVIDRLERMLARAKAGEVASVAIVAIATDGSNISAFSVSANHLQFVGLVDWVKHRMLQHYEQLDD